MKFEKHGQVCQAIGCLLYITLAWDINLNKVLCWRIKNYVTQARKKESRLFGRHLVLTAAVQTNFGFL